MTCGGRYAAFRMSCVGGLRCVQNDMWGALRCVQDDMLGVRRKKVALIEGFNPRWEDLSWEWFDFR